jgi:hypothetical protein
VKIHRIDVQVRLPPPDDPETESKLGVSKKSAEESLNSGVDDIFRTA